MGDITRAVDIIKAVNESGGTLSINHLVDAFAEVRAEVAPSVTARMAVAFLLTRIGSWTNARWDQHLRHEIGDAAADEAIRWIEQTFKVKEFGSRPASEPWPPTDTSGSAPEGERTT